MNTHVPVVLSITHAQARFSMGRVLCTPGALRALEESGTKVEDLLSRHAVGDWGRINQSDSEQNELALEVGLRLLSNYQVAGGASIWIITEWDRSATTVLLPSEY